MTKTIKCDKCGTSNISFKIENDTVIKEVPLPQYGEFIYQQEVVIDKETFIKCYNEWIKPIKNPQKAKWIPKDFFHNDYSCSNCGYKIEVFSEEELPCECPICLSKMTIEE